MTTKDSLFDSILETSINTGLKTNLNNVISGMGVKIPSDAGLWEYPDIIRKNLVSKTITGINILGKDIINIDTSSDGEILTYNLSTSFDTSDVDYPNYIDKIDDWGKKLSVDEVFNKLFNIILPAVRGVHAGDITTSNINGEDNSKWNNTLFNKTGLKTGLEPTSRYLRLYLTCQAEPIYVNLGNLITEVTNGYNVTNSDTIDFTIDNDNNTISAHVNTISDKQLSELGI